MPDPWEDIYVVADFPDACLMVLHGHVDWLDKCFEVAENLDQVVFCLRILRHISTNSLLNWSHAGCAGTGGMAVSSYAMFAKLPWDQYHMRFFNVALSPELIKVSKLLIYDGNLIPRYSAVFS